MNHKVKVISFDAEGTLVTLDFSQHIWHKAIPKLYAEHRGISFEEAKSLVHKEYDLVGEHRMEWYDIKYWFNYFGLNDYRQLFLTHKHQISFYPEVEGVLFKLSQSYRLIVASSTAREFLDFQLEGVKNCFARIFSSISDYRGLKTADFYLEVCRAMGIEPEEMAHVGDSWEFDFLNSREAGIKAFYLDRGGERQGSKVVRDLSQFQRKLGRYSEYH